MHHECFFCNRNIKEVGRLFKNYIDLKKRDRIWLCKKCRKKRRLSLGS